MLSMDQTCMLYRDHIDPGLGLHNTYILTEDWKNIAILTNGVFFKLSKKMLSDYTVVILNPRFGTQVCLEIKVNPILLECLNQNKNI